MLTVKRLCMELLVRSGHYSTSALTTGGNRVSNSPSHSMPCCRFSLVPGCFRSPRNSGLCRCGRRLTGRRCLRPLQRLLRWRVSFCVLVVVLVVYLHYKILPQSMSYYNDDCVMKEEKRESMRFVLRHVVQFLNDENVTYWLDFGTLLGIIREGDIMVHDGDLDISRLADDLKADSEIMTRFASSMRTLGIEGSEMAAKFKDVQVDLFRWQTHNVSGQTVLKKWYPFIPMVNYGEVISDFLFPPDVPTRVLFPLRQISVFGVYANVPAKLFAFLKIKYPLTWFVSFPYKWKCWTSSS